jgi:ADP-dependent NAD(P)H-hydrate dehydratase / NAD(P)H-hydrate epimerase
MSTLGASGSIDGGYHCVVNALLSTDRIRAIERDALAATGEGALMQRAARAVADACARQLRALPARTPVLALIGPGNNGGDALLAAMMLRALGYQVDALAPSAAPPSAAQAPDAARVRARWDAQGGRLEPADRLAALLAQRPLVIDGLFGIGLVRPIERDSPPGRIVQAVNDAGLPVVAVDVPSGLNADRGCVVGDGVAMQATVTVTMIADKPGLRTGAGAALAGCVVVADLGLASMPGEPGDVGRLLSAPDFAGAIAPRARDAHKGRFGDVLVVGGAEGMRGAALLAALGAQAVGAGRVIVGQLPHGDRPSHGGGATADTQGPPLLHPELMTRALGAGGDLGSADAITVGCGLGTGDVARRLLQAAIAHPAALVVDADGLNLIAADGALRQALQQRATPGCATVLTPHPLEAARLLGTDTMTVQRDRITAACRIADGTGAVVLLKGAGTVVAEPGGRWTINASGGPILSVAGTGDVLAGAIAGLLAGAITAQVAQVTHAAHAARLGAWLHGAAGDALASRADYHAGIGLAASRLAEAIRERINQLP